MSIIGPNLDIIVFGGGCLFVLTLMLKLAKLKFLKAMACGVLFSDVVIAFVHPLKITNGEIISQDGDITLYLYYTGSLLFLLIFSLIMAYKNRSKNCIIPCCRPKQHFYDTIPEATIT